MDDTALQRARSVSTQLFGAKHRLPVAIEVARGPARGIYAARLATLVKASEAQVGTELKRLAAVGLLVAEAPPARKGPGNVPQPYTRAKSPYWKLAGELGKRRLPARRETP